LGKNGNVMAKGGDLASLNSGSHRKRGCRDTKNATKFTTNTATR